LLGHGGVVHHLRRPAPRAVLRDRPRAAVLLRAVARRAAGAARGEQERERAEEPRDGRQGLHHLVEHAVARSLRGVQQARERLMDRRGFLGALTAGALSPLAGPRAVVQSRFRTRAILLGTAGGAAPQRSAGAPA